MRLLALRQPGEGRRFDEADEPARRDVGVGPGAARHVVRDAFGERAACLVDDVGDLRVDADAAGEEPGPRLGVLLDVGEVRSQAELEPFDGRQMLQVLRLLRRFEQRRGSESDELDVELALRAEVVKDEALRDAGSRGEVVHGDLVVRPLEEEVLRDAEQLLAALLCVEALAHGRTGGA